MKKLRLGLVAGTVLALFVVLIWRAGSPASKFAVGLPLPHGKVMPQIVSTMDTAVLLAPDGSLWGWGGSRFGLTALFAKRTVTEHPQRIGLDSDWRMVGVGWVSFILALKDDGSLWGQGNNSAGQLAQSNPRTNFSKLTRIGAETNWAQISVGAGHCIALKRDGSLWGWGQNESGQVGDGTISNKFAPTLLSPQHNWKTIATGNFNSFALKADGTIWGWGLDPISAGKSNTLAPAQIDPGSNWVSFSASEFSLLALKSDGTLWIRGQNAQYIAPYYVKAATAAFTQIGADNDWKEVYAGQSFFIAQKRDGGWWACGNNQSGELCLGKRTFKSALQLQRLPIDFEPWAFATGMANTVLLTRDGALWTWGERLGSDGPLAQAKLKEAINSVLNRTFKNGPLFKTQGPKTDYAPFRIWELPPTMKKSITQNARGQNQGGSNAESVKEVQP